MKPQDTFFKKSSLSTTLSEHSVFDSASSDTSSYKPPAHDTFEEAIDAIVNDRQHGSSILADRICAEFKRLRGNKQSLQKLSWAFARLRTIDRSMVVVYHLLDALEPYIGDHFFTWLEAYEARWLGLDEVIAKRLIRRKDWRNKRILTHSHSGVVIRVVAWVAHRMPGLEIWQTRSEPEGEGALQFQALRDAGIATRLVEDADLPRVASKLDAAWLGMDQYNDRHFVNKRGSRGIVATMTALGKPVFVLGDSRKRLPKLRYSGDVFEEVRFTEGVTLITERTG
ncbi:hypothetical protein [Marinobacter caseinilyticus]|uniref:hypothetical protein n=1 Tax=Marinobacter caseinilyticus TaxID=2692195 RepID=UPI00140A6081|nr:hypothetical protein [Marinobacter caseinilyticus]